MIVTTTYPPAQRAANAAKAAAIAANAANAMGYGLTPSRFMGRQLYEKAALYAAIEGAEEWQRFDSTGAAARPASTGRKAASASAGPLANLTPVRRREYVPRKKQN